MKIKEAYSDFPDTYTLKFSNTFFRFDCKQKQTELNQIKFIICAFSNVFNQIITNLEKRSYDFDFTDLLFFLLYNTIAMV